MSLAYQVLSLPLEFPFTISRSTLSVAKTVLVQLSDPDNPGHDGLGEAVPSEFYGESIETVQAFYQQLARDEAFLALPPENHQAFEAYLNQFPGNAAAKSGLDIAFWDRFAKRLGRPLHQVWGLDPAACPKTSYTIGIADLAMVRHKTETALSRGYDVLKVKLGGPQDLDTLSLIRELAPSATLRVDANAAWRVSDALALMPTLATLGVEFVEEPLLLDSPVQDYERLKAESVLPVMADESCKTLKDIPFCGRYFHAINLKHSKTGGLMEAMRMIHAARAHDLKIMLGCFSESLVSISGFAQLAPLVDYCDLDGCLLISQDPFQQQKSPSGQPLKFHGSVMQLSLLPGIGIPENPLLQKTSQRF
ncbi:MAG: dipeptide epimerase [Cyanobacteria bacterium]|nr:dipeptide epimerase [Cyanobacteriota bacterium]